MKQRYTIPPDWCKSITLTKESTFTSAFDKVRGTEKTSLPPQIRDQNNYRLPLNRSPSLCALQHSVLQMEASQNHFLNLSIQNQKAKKKEATGALGFAEDLIFLWAG